MKFTELKQSIESGAKPIYLLEGEEVYFTDRGEAMLKRAFLTEEALNFTSFSAEGLKGTKLRELIDALTALPMFGERRMVKVSDFSVSEKDYDTYLKGYFERPSPSTIFLIVNHGGKKAGAADWKKKPNVTYVDCSRADEETVFKWVYLTLKKAGIAADASACTAVVKYCLADMARVFSETQKLIAYASDTGIVTESDVREIVYKDAEYKIYEMSNAIARGNLGAFYEIKEELSAKGYDDNAILSTLAAYFKTLYEIKIAKGTDAALAKSLEMKEYAVKKNREQAAKFTKEGLLFYYNGIFGAISDMRMGKLTPDGAMELVIAQIFFNPICN